MTTEIPVSHSAPITLREFDRHLSPYRNPTTWESVWQIASTLVLFVLSWALMYFALSVSYWLSFALVIPTALLSIRMFIIQHDCGHRSLFKSKKVNDAVGAGLGVLMMTPYHSWRREHAIHHANAGDLGRRGRGQGEIRVMTAKEYREASWRKRVLYRIYRHPLVLFFLGPIYVFFISHRLAFTLPKAWKRERRNIHWTNLGIAALFSLMCWLVGPATFFMLHVPVMILAAQIGIWLFYVQHQYEEAYYRNSESWDYVQAAMSGCSYYRLPKILQWFTGSIGIHHIHHLDSRIPNYRLQQCLDEQPALQAVKVLTIRESLACVIVKLWDEDKGEMVGFREALSPAPQSGLPDAPSADDLSCRTGDGRDPGNGRSSGPSGERASGPSCGLASRPSCVTVSRPDRALGMSPANVR